MQDSCDDCANLVWAWELRQSACSPAAPLPFQWWRMADRANKGPAPTTGQCTALRDRPPQWCERPHSQIWGLFCAAVMERACGSSRMVKHLGVKRASVYPENSFARKYPLLLTLTSAFFPGDTMQLFHSSHLCLLRCSGSGQSLPLE